MSVKSQTLVHPLSKATVQTWRGFSWPALFFNGFWYFRQGLLALGVLMIGLTVVTGGLGWLVLPFVANDLHRTALLDRGFVDHTDAA